MTSFWETGDDHTYTNESTTGPLLDVNDMLSDMQMLMAQLPAMKPIPELHECSLLTVPGGDRTEHPVKSRAGRR